MCAYKFKLSLKKTLKKLSKKDKAKYNAVLKKIQEIINSDNPHHYKNLRYDMKSFKRVHVSSHFVLIFKINDSEKVIEFYDLDHHDNIYRR